MGPTDSTVRLLCWEGYDTVSMVDRFHRHTGLELHAETLLSDALTARRLCDGELPCWDLLNINNAYIRDYLHPRGVIQTLDLERFARYQEAIHPVYSDLLPYSFDSAGELIGIGQRFGPFNLVVNTKAIDLDSAQDQGFDLANSQDQKGRFAILDYPDFNVFHFCIGAGLDPFSELDETALEQFEKTALTWYRDATCVSDDHHYLNRELIAGNIDFYISGGIYTASPARLEGHLNISAVTPRRGPIDGKGGIVFTEITSVLKHAEVHPLADRYLSFMLEPETTAAIAFIEGTCNPVAQMGDQRVFEAFSAKQLQAIQWDTLETDLARCSTYQIPPQNDQLLAILDQARRKADNT